MRSCSDGTNALWLCAICEITKPRLLPAAMKGARANVAPAATDDQTAPHLTLPYPPTANHLTMVVKGRRIKTAKHREYAEVCKQAAAGMEQLAGEVTIRLNVYRPMRCGDLDNCLKAVLDGIKGAAYQDDRQIVGIEARRFEDKARPRVEVWIEAA